MKEKRKGSRELLAAKIGILLIIAVGTLEVIYFWLDGLFVPAIGVSIIMIIGIAIFWWIICEISKKQKEKENRLMEERMITKILKDQLRDLLIAIIAGTIGGFISGAIMLFFCQ